MRIVGVDTGGTFTDLVLLGPGGLRVHKVPSTPDDPSRAVAIGLEEIGVERGEDVRHGSTVGTNTLLERKGARVALVTTRGFRDLLEIGRQTRPSLYDLAPHRLPPLVERRLRLEITERILHDGRVAVGLDEGEIPVIVRRIRRARAESVAVCLLHAYANPVHERRLARALAPLGLPVSLSSRISPQYREYERFSTTAANAYLAPVMRRYLGRLSRRVGPRLRIMQSNGGLTPARDAVAHPVRTVLSGPAAGVVAAARVARAAGHPRVITFDMGGTSTDVCLVRGEPSLTSEFEIAGCPIRLPVVDVHTVGAGGGSIARRDPGGALRVGPESAGADPGPACHGKGDRPTVTDAQIVLGRLRPEDFLAGTIPVDPNRSLGAVRRLGRELGLSPDETAEGIVRVALATMERAVKVISLERGHDPRDFTLVAFGGAGGLHAAALARGLGIPTILVPPDPGTLSALGLCLAHRTLHLARTVLLGGRRGRIRQVARTFLRMERQARSTLGREGIPEERIRIRRRMSLRYAGQAHELDLPYRGGDPARGFDDAHRARYGTSFPGRGVEVVHLRLRAEGRIGGRLPRRPPPPPSGRRGARSPIRAPARFLPRASLAPGDRIRGPAVLTEYSSTVWIPAGSTAEVDARGNLLIRVGLPGRPRTRR